MNDKKPGFSILLVAIAVLGLVSIFFLITSNKPLKEEQIIPERKTIVSEALKPQPLIYADFDPPLHPNAQMKLDNIDKSKIVLSQLKWVKWSVLYENSGLEERNAFDFKYPREYFVDSLSLEQGGYCAELRNKEEVLIKFCKYDDADVIAQVKSTFSDNKTAKFNGKEGLYRISDDINIYPKQELFFVDEGIHLKYPWAPDDTFVPKRPAEWEENKEWYIKTDLPITKMILDSFTFN